jgi:hypothetical protein
MTFHLFFVSLGNGKLMGLHVRWLKLQTPERTLTYELFNSSSLLSLFEFQFFSFEKWSYHNNTLAQAKNLRQ